MGGKERMKNRLNLEKDFWGGAPPLAGLNNLHTAFQYDTQKRLILADKKKKLSILKKIVRIYALCIKY